MASRRALEGVQVMGVRSAGRRRRAGDAGATGALLTIGACRPPARRGDPRAQGATARTRTTRARAGGPTSSRTRSARAST